MMTRTFLVASMALFGIAAGVPTAEKRLDKISILAEAGVPVQPEKRFDKISLIREATIPVQAQAKRLDEVARLQAV